MAIRLLSKKFSVPILLPRTVCHFISCQASEAYRHLHLQLLNKTPSSKVKKKTMEDSSLCITATVLSGHWTYEFVHLTLRHTLKLNEEWTIRVIPKNSFLITCPSYSTRDHALMLKLFTKIGGAFYVQQWSGEEFEPEPAFEAESWARVVGFPEFLKTNVPAIKELMTPMGNVCEIDDCHWSRIDHRSLYLKMEFYEGIGLENVFAARFDNKKYIIRVERTTHTHPLTRPEILFVSNREEPVVPFFCDHR